MSDFDHEWGMEHDLHVDHDGGVDHALMAFPEDHHGYDLQHETYAEHDGHVYAEDGDLDTAADTEGHHEPLILDEPELDLPDFQLDTQFLDGHYDLVGADPGENDMWSQFMTDMHEEVNPYAAN